MSIAASDLALSRINTPFFSLLLGDTPLRNGEPGLAEESDGGGRSGTKEGSFL